jgi:hypothetical protein
MFTYLTLLISYVQYILYFNTIYCILPMPLSHRSSIYLDVHIPIPPLIHMNVKVVVVELLDNLLDITALSELEAHAFHYTRNNIC